MSSSEPAAPRPSSFKAVLPMVLGALCGSGMVVLLIKVGLTGRWADMAILLLAGISALSGIYLLWLAARPERLGHSFALGDAATAREVSGARMQALVLLLGAVVLSVPALAAGAGEGARLIGLAAVVALALAQGVVNGLIRRRGDELARRAIAESGAACFALLQGGLVVYAAAERLELVPPATAWDLLAASTGVYVLVSTFGLRRNLG